MRVCLICGIQGPCRHSDRQRHLARVIHGALKSTLIAHGPITVERMPSATKRLLGVLQAEGALDGPTLTRCDWCGTTTPADELEPFGRNWSLCVLCQSRDGP